MEKERLSSLLNKLTETLGDLSDRGDERKKLIVTIKNIIDEQLTDDERLLFYEIIFEELSFRNLVRHPEFMIKQSNVRLRSMMFTGGIFLLFVISFSLIFSDNFIIKTIKEIFKHIFDIMTI